MGRMNRGVTLVELLVVVTIIGILAAIAIPSYRQYVIRTNRTDAKTQLLRTAQSLERCYNNSTPYAYDSAVCVAAVTFPVATEGGNYQITASTLTATEFTLEAAPQGGQTADAKCATLTLTHAGVQDTTGTGTPEECWRR